MTKPKRKKMGRPVKVEIDDQKLCAFLRLKPTIQDAAAFFECQENTIRRHCQKVHGKTYESLRLEKAVHTRHAIMRACIEKALKGDNTMLIWCSKNLCGWTDRAEPGNELPTQTTFNLNYSLDREPAKAKPK